MTSGRELPPGVEVGKDARHLAGPPRPRVVQWAWWSLCAPNDLSFFAMYELPPTFHAERSIHSKYTSSSISELEGVGPILKMRPPGLSISPTMLVSFDQVFPP